MRIGMRSVRYKLLLVVVATTLAALVVTGAAMVFYDVRAYQRSWVDDLMTQADILGRVSAPALAFHDPTVAAENLSVHAARPQISAAAIYAPNGAVFATYAAPGNLDTQLPRLPEADGFRIEGKELVVFKRIVDNREILGTVYMRARYELVERVTSYVAILTVVMIASLLVAVLFSSWLHSGVIKPILAVSDVARRVSDTRDFSLRATKTTTDEVGDLVDGFNEMLVEIERLAQVQRHAEQELQKLNAELEQRVAARTAELQSANKEMEGFSYSVSHDLRAPLRAISGFAKILGEDHVTQLDDEGRRKLGIIQSEAKRMGALIDDLLAFSRLGRKAMDPIEVDMAGLARSTFQRLHTQYDGARPELRMGPLPRVVGDRGLLEQVWANLVSNAIKYSSKRDKPIIEIGSISDENEHIYYIRDNGAGFDPRYKSKLFGVFQRLHNAEEFSGTGVGLALVQRIVVRHGGRVWADGKPDEGATFHFTIPKEGRNAGS
jgi:signal transduction histidine kinase